MKSKYSYIVLSCIVIFIIYFSIIKPAGVNGKIGSVMKQLAVSCQMYQLDNKRNMETITDVIEYTKESNPEIELDMKSIGMNKASIRYFPNASKSNESLLIWNNDYIIYADGHLK